MQLILFIFFALSTSFLSAAPLRETPLDCVNAGTFFCPALWGQGIPKERSTAYFYDPEERRIRYGRVSGMIFFCEDDYFRFKIPEKSLPMPNDKGIYIFYPTCGLFLSPKTLTEKFEALAKTEAYLRFEEDAYRKEVPFSDFVSHFSQHGGCPAVIDKKYPVASYLRYILPSVIAETNPDFIEHSRVVSEFNALLYSLVRWVYRREDEKKYPEIHGPRGAPRAIYELSEGRGVRLSEGRILYGYRKDTDDLWVYSLASLLQKEGVETFASCTVFETNPAFPIFIVLRYHVKGDIRRFKDILISCEPEQKEAVKYFGVISEFDVKEDRRVSPPKAPAYEFDPETQTIFHTVPFNVY